MKCFESRSGKLNLASSSDSIDWLLISIKMANNELLRHSQAINGVKDIRVHIELPYFSRNFLKVPQLNSWSQSLLDQKLAFCSRANSTKFLD
jgi:hypothetical protein